MRRPHIVFLIAVMALMVFATACSGRPTQIPPTGSGPAEEEFEAFDPKSFTDPTTIDNQWMPLKPGTRFVYEGHIVEDGETLPFRLEFTVTDLTKEIGGVRTVVAWILDYKEAELVEKEIAFYAQDNDGNVWYLGEHPEEYEDGNFITAPTWIHGFQDARAGIKMHAAPQLGSPSFSQGWGPAVDFRDRGQVSQMGLETCVPAGCYKDVIVIDEFTLVEPDAFQLKYYAPGVGNIQVGWRGADAQQEELDLIEVTQISPEDLAKVRAEALDLEKHAYEVSKEAYGNTLPAQ